MQSPAWNGRPQFAGRHRAGASGVEGRPQPDDCGRPKTSCGSFLSSSMGVITASATAALVVKAARVEPVIPPGREGEAGRSCQLEHARLALEFARFRLACRWPRTLCLGSSDELPEHDSNSGEQYEASVVCEELVVSGCDAPELLQFIEETLDEIALLVERLVVGERRAAIGF